MPSAVIILPFLLTTVMGVRSYTAPPSGTENGLLTSTASPGEGSYFIRELSPLLFVNYKTGSLGNNVMLSFDFAPNICHIYITLLSTFETKMGLETGKR